MIRQYLSNKIKIVLFIGLKFFHNLNVTSKRKQSPLGTRARRRAPSYSPTVSARSKSGGTADTNSATRGNQPREETAPNRTEKPRTPSSLPINRPRRARRRPPMLAGDGRGRRCPARRRTAPPAALAASSPRYAPPAPGPSPSRPASPPPSPTSSSRTMAASRSSRPRPPSAGSAAPPLRLRLPVPPRPHRPRRPPLRLPLRSPSQSHRRIGPGPPTFRRPSPDAAAKAAALASALASSRSAAWCRSRSS